MKSILIAALTFALGANAMECISLDGLWDFTFHDNCKPENMPREYTITDKMPVPACFDIMPGYYAKRGIARYRRSFTLEKDVLNAFLVIKGMGLRGTFWIDGRQIGYSKLAYSTLEFATGPLAKGDHVIEAAINNRLFASSSEIFQPFYDFFASGGFYHGVELKLQTRQVELDRVFVRTRDYSKGLVELELDFKGVDAAPSLQAQVSFDGEAPKSVSFVNGRARLTVPSFKLWSPQSPNLHRVEVVPHGKKGRASARFGIRQFTCGKGRFWLNGAPIFLKGVNRHDADFQNGYATTVQSIWRDVMLIKKLGCNFVRSVHYTPSDDFLSLCDEAGLLVWQEALGWGNWQGQLNDPEFIRLQIEQAKLMARNSLNHPSAVIDAFLNEFGSSTAEGKELANMLIAALRSVDSGRPISYAASQNANDISNENTDFVAFNIYPAWHQQQGTGTTPESLENCMKSRFAEVTKIFRERHGPDKPIMIGETGCYSFYGCHDEAAAQWSEEFQAEYLQNSLQFAFGSPDISGIAIWQFCDSRTYRRGGADIRTKPLGVNMAGLFDIHRREKLAAGKVRSFYTKEKR